jgi:hypothetical protein
LLFDISCPCQRIAHRLGACDGDHPGTLVLLLCLLLHQLAYIALLLRLWLLLLLL